MKEENEHNANSSTSSSLPEISTSRKAVTSNTSALTLVTTTNHKSKDRLLSKEENKRRNIERFGAGGNLESLTESVVMEPSDPLSSIDPLWSIKKKPS